MQEVRWPVQKELNPYVWVNITLVAPKDGFQGKLEGAVGIFKLYDDFISALPPMANYLKEQGVKYKIKLVRKKGIFTYLACLLTLKTAVFAFNYIGKDRYEERFKK